MLLLAWSGDPRVADLSKVKERLGGVQAAAYGALRFNGSCCHQPRAELIAPSSHIVAGLRCAFPLLFDSWSTFAS